MVVNMKFSLFLLFFFIAIPSCVISPLDNALNIAVENRLPLESFLEKYKSDSLKYQAASFLVENMPYHTYYDSADVAQYEEYYHLFANSWLSAEQVVDSMRRKYGTLDSHNWRVHRDIQTVDTAYLSECIDHSVWLYRTKPWCKDLDFNTFCEYVLSYRCGNEYPNYHPREVYDRYSSLLDTVTTEDPLVAAQIVLDSLSHGNIHFGSLLSGPNVGVNIIDYRAGGCKEYADINAYVLRSLGIPCSIDMMLIRGDYNVAHFFNGILGKDGELRWAEFPEKALRKREEFHFAKGKLYRKTFSLNRDMHDAIRKYTDTPHPVFNYPHMVDVTADYSSYAKDINVPLEWIYGGEKKGEVYYLCLSRRREWTPVDWSIIRDGKLTFKDVEGRVVFCLATYDENGLKVVSDPFLMEKESGELKTFACNEDTTETATFFYKFHLYNEWYIGNMPGYTFQGSNSENYRVVDTLHTITKVPKRLYNTVYLPQTGKKYKFARVFGSPDSRCDISEVEFYEHATDIAPLKGEIQGTPGCWYGDGSHEYTNVFDGDPYTSFNYKEPYGGWAGLKFDEPKTIEKIVYVPRNRDNFIRKGDTYELFYFSHSDWHSLGKQTATSDSLVYEIPKGALLYLHDETRGYDERISQFASGYGQIIW